MTEAQEPDAEGLERDLAELRILVRGLHERAHDLIQALQSPLSRLDLALRNLHERSHDLVQVIQVPLSELDLTLMEMRKAVDAFYDSHPEPKE
jgi:hypothetical protein